MRVVIVSAGSPDYDDLGAVTNPTRVRYAQRHGYTYVHFRTDKQRGDAAKHDAYMDLWGKGFDAFVWMDLDSCVMNGEHTIEHIIATWMGDRHFLWGYDYAGPNSGVYICRFTPEGAHWMDRAYATMRENGLADETAMEILATTHPFKDYVAVCPGYVLNSYPYKYFGWDKWGVEYGRKINRYEPGRFILHLPGLPNEERIPILQRFIEEAR